MKTAARKGNGRLLEAVLQSRVAEVKQSHRMVPNIGAILDCSGFTPSVVDDSESDNDLSESASEGEVAPCDENTTHASVTEKQSAEMASSSMEPDSQSLLSDSQPPSPTAPTRFRNPSAFQHGHRRVRSKTASKSDTAQELQVALQDSGDRVAGA
mmetsp:Transcript_95403/g.169371  ORF Transcript_95403/g.169371 Transcript_95403/m.169371 type:complete len:155 (+) Transcript_95403:64-528(+)